MSSWRFSLDFLMAPAKAQGAAAEQPGSLDGEVGEEEEADRAGEFDSTEEEEEEEEGEYGQ